MDVCNCEALLERTETSYRGTVDETPGEYLGESGEYLETFIAALNAQAARSGLETSKDELVRELDKSKMRNTMLWDTLTFEIMSLVELLDKAMKCEQSKQTKFVFQKKIQLLQSTQRKL